MRPTQFPGLIMFPSLATPFQEICEWQAGVLESLICVNYALHTEEEIISWFTQLKTFTELDVQRCNIDELDNWVVNEWEIEHIEKRFFKVIGVEVSIGNREVSTWCQPLIEQREEGIIGFIVKRINGVYHLLIQAKLEAGNFDVLEMAPTVQCITGSYRNPDWAVPYLEYFTGDQSVIIRFDTRQSEEGGRFFHEQNRNVVVEVGDVFPALVDQRYIWMTFRQAKQFIKFNNYFNIEARSLIACISLI
jgi:dTDP-4-dehydro-6-deoxy-alpha-D-glucopyranose 2,3-dehydratase